MSICDRYGKRRVCQQFSGPEWWKGRLLKAAGGEVCDKSALQDLHAAVGLHILQVKIEEKTLKQLSLDHSWKLR